RFDGFLKVLQKASTRLDRRCLRHGVAASSKLRIGSWTVCPALNLLEREGESVRLEPRVMDVLVYLAERPGEVVSIAELMAAVWKGVVVADGSVYVAIKALRRALAAGDGESGYIETIPKRGYRLTAAIEPLSPTEVPVRAPGGSPSPA